MTSIEYIPKLYKTDCQNCRLHEISFKDEKINCECNENRIEHNYSCTNRKSKNNEGCIHCQIIDKRR